MTKYSKLNEPTPFEGVDPFATSELIIEAIQTEADPVLREVQALYYHILEQLPIERRNHFRLARDKITIHEQSYYGEDEEFHTTIDPYSPIGIYTIQDLCKGYDFYLLHSRIEQKANHHGGTVVKEYMKILIGTNENTDRYIFTDTKQPKPLKSFIK